jgi:hypothetical protein
LPVHGQDAHQYQEHETIRSGLVLAPDVLDHQLDEELRHGDDADTGGGLW